MGRPSYDHLLVPTLKLLMSLSKLFNSQPFNNINEVNGHVSPWMDKNDCNSFLVLLELPSPHCTSLHDWYLKLLKCLIFLKILLTTSVFSIMEVWLHFTCFSASSFYYQAINVVVILAIATESCSTPSGFSPSWWRCSLAFMLLQGVVFAIPAEKSRRSKWWTRPLWDEHSGFYAGVLLSFCHVEQGFPIIVFMATLYFWGSRMSTPLCW